MGLVPAGLRLCRVCRELLFCVCGPLVAPICVGVWVQACVGVGGVCVCALGGQCQAASAQPLTGSPPVSTPGSGAPSQCMRLSHQYAVYVAARVCASVHGCRRITLSSVASRCGGASNASEESRAVEGVVEALEQESRCACMPWSDVCARLWELR